MTLNYREQVFEWDGMTVEMPIARQAVREVEIQTETSPERTTTTRQLEDAIPKHLSNNEQGKLYGVLMEHRQVFLPDIGLIPGAPYDIHLTNDTPICLRPYPIPHSLLE